MGYTYPLFLMAGLGGGLLLLGIASFARLASFRKPVMAMWLTILACVWALMPVAERWAFSIWAPSAVVGGQMLFSITPAIWWCGLALILSCSGTAWVTVSEQREISSLSGSLVIIALLTILGALLADSLLTTLAIWAVFDLIWSAAALLSGANGERVTFGLALHGITSLILWMVSLFLLREGQSGLWWLMWPSAPMLTMLLVAALVRVGFYPAQIVFPYQLRGTHLLSLAHFAGPLTGLGLLYRLMTLPVAAPLPMWVSIWGVISLVGNGLMAWSQPPRQRSLRVYHALLITIVVGAINTGDKQYLMTAAAVWITCLTLLMLNRGRDSAHIAWSWPGWLAVFFLLGAPPSPLGSLIWTWFNALPWLWRTLLMIGYMMNVAVLLQDGWYQCHGQARPPWIWQQISLVLGLTLVLGVMLAITITTPPPSFSWLGWGLWLLAIAGAGALARWGTVTRQKLRLLQPLLEFLDLQWFYRSMWRGAEHLLGILRASAEIFEGSGAMIWSLLTLLLVLLVVGNR